MKKAVLPFVLILALFTFNGCGEDTEDGTGNIFGGDDSGETIDNGNGGNGSFVSVSDLATGYKIDGSSVSNATLVSFIFCGRDYDFTRNGDRFSGTFNTVNGGTKIDFSDAGDGGSYSLSSATGTLEVGDSYSFTVLPTTIIVDDITPIECF